MSSAPQQLAGPGFVTVVLDVPFPISVPNGAYFAYDPVSQVGCVEVALREGSKAFFRNRPITGPNSFRDLLTAVAAQQRPRGNRSYITVSQLPSGSQKATLNIHGGEDGGYAECKYYSQASVTFLVDDIQMIALGDDVLRRALAILNPFLDKYRLLNENYRIARVSQERNYYFAQCHVSPLTAEEVGLGPSELFQRLAQPRTFFSELGHGGANVLRGNSYELLGPRSELRGQVLDTFESFIQSDYEMPLAYDLILEALAYLQRFRDCRLAVVHAETAFEVYVVSSLLRLMVDSGMHGAQASSLIENDTTYWGVKRKIRQHDHWTQQYCLRSGIGFSAFIGSNLYTQWESDLYQRRNAAVHAGANTFTYDQALVGIGRAKECIVFLEGRVPAIANRVQLNPSMAGFRQNPGEVMF